MSVTPSHGKSVLRDWGVMPPHTVITGKTQSFCGNGVFPTDLDKLDNEKKDLIQSDIAALHQFYSKYLEFPDHSSLVVLFAQVRKGASPQEDLLTATHEGIYLTGSWTPGEVSTGTAPGAHWPRPMRDLS